MSANQTDDLSQKSYQTQCNELLDQCGVFWAFCEEQFVEGYQECKDKGFLNEGEKVVSIGSGGYCPESQVDALNSGFTKLSNEEKKRLQRLQPEKKKAFIIHELVNYEAFYCDDGLEDALKVLGERGFTADEVMAVYHEKAAEIADNSF